MAKKNTVKLVFKKTSPITKAAILAAVTLSLVALVALFGAIGRIQSNYNALRQQAIELESGNAKLEQQIDDLGTLESIIRIAKEELGLIFPGSVTYTPGN